MSNDVTYQMKDVTGKLGARIANLEVQLAHESAAKKAYATRVKELEKEIGKDEPNDSETK